MAQRTWKLNIDEVQHEVLLKHGPIPGREIWLDGKLIEKGRVRLDFGSDHFFSVCSHPVELGIVSNAWGYEYYLKLDGKFVFSNKDKKQIIGKATQKKLKEKEKWINLGKEHDLFYYPKQTKRFVYEHRLIGYANDHLVVIEPGLQVSGEASIPGVLMILRHADIDPEKSKMIMSDNEIKKLVNDWPIRKGSLEINQCFTSLFLDVDAKKTDEDLAVDFILDFIAATSKYVKPPIKEKCEGMNCRMRIGQKIQLTLLNDVPYLMCQNCIDTIDKVGERAQEDYKKTPSNLFKGIIYGLGGMLLGALAWALIFIFLDRIGAVFAVFNFFIIIKAMDYAKTKRTFISLFLASILALSGSVLGSYLGVVGYLIKEQEITINLEDLILVAKFLVEDWEILSDTIFFSLLGVVPYLFMILSARRRELKSAFKPNIEVVTTFPVRT